MEFGPIVVEFALCLSVVLIPPATCSTKLLRDFYGVILKSCTKHIAYNIQGGPFWLSGGIGVEELIKGGA